MSGLEPVVSGKLMEYHYDKHHKTYVKNLNSLTEKAEDALSTGNTEEYVRLCKDIKFNGGGHFNHEFFWESLAPIKEGGGVVPDKKTDLRTQIDMLWGTVYKFQEYFSK